MKIVFKEVNLAIFALTVCLFQYKMGIVLLLALKFKKCRNLFADFFLPVFIEGIFCLHERTAVISKGLIVGYSAVSDCLVAMHEFYRKNKTLKKYESGLYIYNIRIIIISTYIS